MIRLVVSAEDFGSSAEADDHALQAHRDGIVTSVSVLGNAPELPQVVSRIREAPALGSGLALVLTGGAPVAPPDQIASLLRPDGTLRARRADFVVDWARGTITPGHVERELEAQIERARAAGLALDHLCTSRSLGFLPGVGRIVETLARRFGIAGIRASVEPPGLGWVADPRRGAETALLAGLAWLTRRQMGHLRHGPLTWGYVESDRLDDVRILETIGRLAPGAHELLCHPAGPGGPGEVAALTSEKVRTAIRDRGIVLCRWRDVF